MTLVPRRVYGIFQDSSSRFHFPHPPFLSWSRGVVDTLLLFKFIGSLDWSGRPRLQLAVSMPSLVIGLNGLTSNAGRLPRPLQHAKSARHCVLQHP